MTSLRLKQ